MRNMPFITQGKANLKYILIVVILAVIVGGGILGYYYLWIAELEAKLAELEARIPRKVTIENILPSSGSLGTEIIIYGSGFTPTNNDIAFTHKKINFQGSNTGYVSGVASINGKTLRFNLPDNDNVLLGACAFSQMKPKEACPAIGILLPIGEVQISVVNKNGISNSVTFTVE